MKQATVSSKGQISIPKSTRIGLNLDEVTKLVISKEPAWKKLAGTGSGRNLMAAFAADKKTERKREAARS